jgi:hypothetical protein
MSTTSFAANKNNLLNYSHVEMAGFEDSSGAKMKKRKRTKKLNFDPVINYMGTTHHSLNNNRGINSDQD